jgi:hypothetical protein
MKERETVPETLCSINSRRWTTFAIMAMFIVNTASLETPRIGMALCEPTYAESYKASSRPESCYCQNVRTAGLRFLLRVSAAREEAAPGRYSRDFRLTRLLSNEGTDIRPFQHTSSCHLIRSRGSLGSAPSSKSVMISLRIP